MTETWKTEAEVLADLPVGENRAISAQDVRDGFYSGRRPEVVYFQNLEEAPEHVEGAVHYRGGTWNFARSIPGVVVNLPEEVQTPLSQNTSGGLLANGTAVYVSGATGNKPTLGRASNADASSQSMIGLVTHDIASNGYGYATTYGLVRELNTSAWVEGTELFLGVDGALTHVPPVVPSRLVSVGYVVYQHASAGEVLVSIRRLRDLVQYGELYWSENSTATVLTADTWAKAAGTTTLALASAFDMPESNRLRHTDSVAELYKVTFDFSILAEGVNKHVYVGLAKGGAASPAASSVRHRLIGTGSDAGMGATSGLFLLGENEYVEAYVKSTDGADVTIEYGALIATKGV